MILPHTKPHNRRRNQIQPDNNHHLYIALSQKTPLPICRLSDQEFCIETVMLRQCFQMNINAMFYKLLNNRM